MNEISLAIEGQSLSKEFGNRPVLRRLDLAVPAGTCLGLTGANGSGKTTLLRCLAGLVRPTAGRVLWFGTPALNRPERRRLIGMVAHDSRLYPQLTLRENLVFAARMHGLAEPRRCADGLLEQIGLAAHADCRPAHISRGLQQRMAFARAVIHAPAILLLDEPFSGLDAEGSRWLATQLCVLRDQGRTICFSSHDPARMEQVADVIYELRGGRLAAVAAPLRPDRPSDPRPASAEAAQGRPSGPFTVFGSTPVREAA